MPGGLPVFSLNHAKGIIGLWKEEYNTIRRHSSLGYSTPSVCARECTHKKPVTIPEATEPKTGDRSQPAEFEEAFYAKPRQEDVLAENTTLWSLQTQDGSIRSQLPLLSATSLERRAAFDHDLLRSLSLFASAKNLKSSLVSVLRLTV